jgi:LysM repeat protein
MEPQPKNISMVFILVVSATLGAIATFLIAVTLLSNRPDPPEQSAPPIAATPLIAQQSTVLVEGVSIRLEIDPDKAFNIPGQVQASGAEDVAQIVPTATFTPVPVGPTATPPPPTRDPNPVIIKDYVVQPGDTLYTVANNNASSIELMALHGIAEDNLAPGTTLALPVGNPAYCPTSQPYVVREKDTVFRIAVQFNTTADVLQAMNGLNQDYFIQAAQVICVPVGG